jgi:acyl carrier protein
MTFEEARSQLVSILDLTTGALSDQAVADRLTSNGDDVALSELDLDSLVGMELCLEIENRTGVTLDLADLATYPSVNALAELMRVRSSAPGR